MKFSGKELIFHAFATIITGGLWLIVVAVLLLVRSRGN